VQRRPVTIWDVIDAAEEYLDENGLLRPHLVGNSLGGFVAIELARRGRASTVCALSPAGFWTDGRGSASRAAAGRKVQKIAIMSRLAVPVGPLIFKSAAVRRISLRFLNSARHGERVSTGKLVEMTRIVAACSVTREVLSTDEEQVAPLDPLPCPITLAWSEKDSLLPIATYGQVARRRLPGATFQILPGVDHAPMLDDPELVARAIMAVTGAATQRP
jgi:pimeloyl-ACP methyl ester carboxylesterase